MRLVVDALGGFVRCAAGFAVAPTPWESSPTATQSSAWSEPSSPNKTTNGPKADATSASTSSPNHDSHHNPPNRRTPHSNSPHNPTRRTQNDYTTPQDLTGGPIGRNQVGEPRGSIQTARARRFWSPLSNFACNSLRASCLFVPVGNVVSLVLWNCMRLS